MVNTLVCLDRGTGFNSQFGRKMFNYKNLFVITFVSSVSCASFQGSEPMENHEEGNGKQPPRVVLGKWVDISQCHHQGSSAT